MQYSKYSNNDGIIRDETSSAQSVCAKELKNTFGNFNVTFYLSVAVVTIPIIATVVTTVILHIWYKKIERLYMPFPESDFWALIIVGVCITVFIFIADIFAFVNIANNNSELDNPSTLFLTTAGLILEIVLGFCLPCVALCCCYKKQRNCFFFQLLITPLSLVSFHTGYIFAAWLTEPSKTTSVAILSLVVIAFMFIMFRFLYIFMEECLFKIYKSCCKEKNRHKEDMNDPDKLNICCTAMVGIIGVGLICVVLASFYKLPLPTIGLVEHLQNIVSICIVFLTGLITYKLIGSNESDTEKFLRTLNKSYQERKMMSNLIKTEALNNYDRISANFKISLQLNKIKITEHGNWKRAIIEVDSSNCIIRDPQNDFDIDVPIDSAKLYTDRFLANEDTFETDFTKCVLEARVVAAKGAQLCRFPVPSDSILNIIDAAKNSNQNSGTTSTPNSGTTSTPNSSTTSTPNSGTTSTPNSGTTSTPNSGNTSTPNSGNTSTPNSDTTSTPNSGTTSTPNSGNTSTPNSGNASNDLILNMDDTALLASRNSICLENLFEIQCSQFIDISHIKINNVKVQDIQSCQLSFSISIPRILSSDHLLSSSVWCPLDGSVIAIMKENGEITRELIPKILSFQIKKKAKGFTIEQGKLFISSKLKKLKLSSLGSKLRINFLIPCNKWLNISKHSSPGDTILLKPQSETQSAANQDATITLPINVASSSMTTLFLKITNCSSKDPKKGIKIIYHGGSTEATQQGGANRQAIQANHEILPTAKNDKMIIAFKSDRSMSLSGIFSSSSPVSLINKEVKLEMKSVNAELHFSWDINTAEIEQVDDDHWNVTFNNVIVSNLKGDRDKGFEIFSLTTMEKSSLFLGFPSYECDIIGDDIETAATICGNLLLSKV